MFDKSAILTGARAGVRRIAGRGRRWRWLGSKVGNQDYRHHLCLKLPCQKHQGGVVSGRGNGRVHME